MTSADLWHVKFSTLIVLVLCGTCASSAGVGNHTISLVS